MTDPRPFLRDLWTLTRPYWFSEERWAARGLLAIVVALNLGIVFLEVLFNRWQNDFYNALQDKNITAFYDLLLYFSVLAAAFIAAAVYQLYLNQMLQIRWRRWLTERYLEEWIGKRTHYRMQFTDGGTDNPDQRISRPGDFGTDAEPSGMRWLSYAGLFHHIWGPFGALESRRGKVNIPGYWWGAMM